jgi:hypothetical protein
MSDAIRSNNAYVGKFIAFENDRVIYCDRYKDVLLDRIIAILSIKNVYGSGSKNSIKFRCSRLSNGVLRSLTLISISILQFYLGVGMTIWINDSLPESWLCQDNLSLTIVPTTIEEIRANCFKCDSQGEEYPIITATVIMGNSVICGAFARVIWQGELAIPTISPSLIW